MASPSFVGSGGGIFAALANRLVEDALIVGYFADRMWTGRAKRETEWPFIIFNHVGGTGRHQSDGWLEKEGQIQVAIFAIGYDASRNLGRDVNAILLRTIFVADGVEGIKLRVQVPGDLAMALDVTKSPDGEDVWMCPYRYRLTLPEYVAA
jgi:hypothetical protein